MNKAYNDSCGNTALKYKQQQQNKSSNCTDLC